MKTSADIALTAGAITTEQPAISIIDAWALAGAVIDALDKEGRLKADCGAERAMRVAVEDAARNLLDAIYQQDRIVGAARQEVAEKTLRALLDTRPVPVVHRQCEDCRRRHNGPGRICPRCRAAEDGQERDVPEAYELADTSTVGPFG